MNFLQPGQQIETEIVAITDDTVFLDLNAKSEGILDRAELADKEGNLSVKEGDKIKAYFVGTKNGEMIFTTKIAGEKADKAMLENAWENKIPVEGKVEKEIKGGYEVRIGNSRAFCPYSQMGFKQNEESYFYVGKVFSFIITEYKKDGRDILVSNRIIAQNEYEEKLEAMSGKITVGAVIPAKVLSLQKFGAFVELFPEGTETGTDSSGGKGNGFKALLPISEVSRSRIEKIEDVLSVGQKISVKVMKADGKNEKVSVSLKELEENPWENAKEMFPAGKKIDGYISRIADFGVFVKVASGIEGLVHVSELDEDRSTNLRKKYNVGDKFSVVVKEVDSAQQRMSLRPASSIEQDNLTAKYMDEQDDSEGETYNPFASLLKKK